MNGRRKTRITYCLSLLLCFLEDQLETNPVISLLHVKYLRGPSQISLQVGGLLGGEASLFPTCTINYRALVKKN